MGSILNVRGKPPRRFQIEQTFCVFVPEAPYHEYSVSREAL